MKKKAVFNWSGGKDSALALKKVIESGEFEIVSLLTTISGDTKESTMHKIPNSLLMKQASALGFEIMSVEIGVNGGMDGYNSAMERAVSHFKKLGVTHFIFGDIHLHDIKKYREEKLHPFGIEVVEPLWNMSSTEAMESFIDSGLKTIVVTVTKRELINFAGKHIDKEFVLNYPSQYDICGEEGEYHTFCYDGAIFKERVDFRIKDVEQSSYNVTYDDGKEETITYWYTPIE